VKANVRNVALASFGRTDKMMQLSGNGKICFDTSFSRFFPALKKPLGDDPNIPEYSDEAFKRQLEAISIAIKARLKVVDS
jgi:hypothetical protein